MKLKSNLPDHLDLGDFVFLEAGIHVFAGMPDGEDRSLHGSGIGEGPAAGTLDLGELRFLVHPLLGIFKGFDFPIPSVPILALGNRTNEGDFLGTLLVGLVDGVDVVGVAVGPEDLSDALTNEVVGGDDVLGDSILNRSIPFHVVISFKVRGGCCL